MKAFAERHLVDVFLAFFVTPGKQRVTHLFALCVGDGVPSAVNTKQPGAQRNVRFRGRGPVYRQSAFFTAVSYYSFYSVDI